jgi:DNA-binding NarL/FixJ family response regulator
VSCLGWYLDRFGVMMTFDAWRSNTRSMTSTSVVPVLVVEDDPRLRDAISGLFAGSIFAPELVGTARDALARLDAIDPRLMLVDLGLPDLDGVELIAELTARRRQTPIIVLTVASTQARIRAALRAGARGYLFKEDLGRRLLTSLDEALHGGIPLSNGVAELLLAELRGIQQPVTSGAITGGALTEREREVLERFARSMTYEEAGADLGLSVNTIRTYVRSIYDKLAVSTRTEAVIAAFDRGLISRA